MRLKFLAGVACATLMSGTGIAQAGTITQSVQFGPGPTDYNAATGTVISGGTPPVFFNYFNSNTGTLTSITFSSSYGFNSTIAITNTSGVTATGNARTQSAAQFAASDNAITTVLNSRVNTDDDPVDGTAVSFGSQTLTPIAYDVRGTRTNYALTNGNTTSFSSIGSAATGGVVDTFAADLAAFSKAGGGLFAPLFNTLSGLVLSNSGGNVQAIQTTTATGTLTITYDFGPPTTVPEPASLAILGAGILGLGLVRRRRA